jgi:hypothetical protein
MMAISSRIFSGIRRCREQMDFAFVSRVIQFFERHESRDWYGFAVQTIPELKLIQSQREQRIIGVRASKRHSSTEVPAYEVGVVNILREAVFKRIAVADPAHFAVRDRAYLRASSGASSVSE